MKKKSRQVVFTCFRFEFVEGLQNRSRSLPDEGSVKNVLNLINVPHRFGECEGTN